MELFGSSGIRGIVGEELTPSFAVRVGAAVGTALGADVLAVGRDTRLSGPMLADALAAGLAGVGVDVLRLGTLSTPAIQAVARDRGCPAAAVTASHNPPPYNGIKLVGDDGVELTVDVLERIERTILEGRAEPAAWDRLGRAERLHTGVDRYVEEVAGAVDREAVAAADLTVAIDPGHGAGALTSPRIFRRLGCRVVTVNAQPDGHFPGRDPEPVPATLGDLERLVRSTDADLGIAHDGDADRAIFVDERGRYVEGDTSLAALADASLEAGDTAVAAVNVSQRLVDVVAGADAELVLTPVGSTNIVTEIRRLRERGERVPIAGEGNGGIYCPPFALRRDGAYVGARLLERLAVTGTAASELLAPYDGYHNVRHDVPYRDDRERETMLQAVEAAAAADAEEPGTTVSDVDGIRVDHGDAWVLARPSGTEPLVRIYAEARDRGRAEALADDLRDRILEVVEQRR